MRKPKGLINLAFFNYWIDDNNVTTNIDGLPKGAYFTLLKYDTTLVYRYIRNESITGNIIAERVFTARRMEREPELVDFKIVDKNLHTQWHAFLSFHEYINTINEDVFRKGLGIWNTAIFVD